MFVFGVGLLVGPAVFSGTINGSLGVNFNVPTKNGVTLADTTLLADTLSPTNGVCTGDFCVAAGSNYGPFTLNLGTIANGGGFSLSSTSTFGGFIATAGTIMQQSANFLDIYLTGLYTGLPNPGLVGCGNNSDPCDPSPTSFRASWTYTGGSLSGSGTLASPPTTVIPEPATTTLSGGALVALGIGLRRRRASR